MRLVRFLSGWPTAALTASVLIAASAAAIAVVREPAPQRREAGRLTDHDPRTRRLLPTPEPSPEATAEPAAVPASEAPVVSAAPQAQQAPTAPVPKTEPAPGCGFTTPKPGRYSYTVTDRYPDDPEPDTYPETLRVLDGSRSGCTAEQEFSYMDEEGDEYTSFQTRWTSKGFEIVSMDEICQWKPSIVDLVLPLKAGLSWTVDSSCTVGSGSDSLTIRYQGRSDVTEMREGFQFAGGKTSVAVISRDHTITFSGGGESFSERHTGKEYFSPTIGLAVVIDDKVEERYPGEPVETYESRTELTSTQPK